jgi:hypothetical protein
VHRIHAGCTICPVAQRMQRCPNPGMAKARALILRWHPRLVEDQLT